MQLKKHKTKLRIQLLTQFPMPISKLKSKRSLTLKIQRNLLKKRNKKLLTKRWIVWLAKHKQKITRNHLKRLKRSLLQTQTTKNCKRLPKMLLHKLRLMARKLMSWKKEKNKLKTPNKNSKPQKVNLKL